MKCSIMLYFILVFTVCKSSHLGLRSFRPIYAACCYFLQEVTVEVLVEGLKKCSGAKGIIVNGYPRSMVQVGEYNKVVSMPID